MTEFYNTFSAQSCTPQPAGFSAHVKRALARSMISYQDAVKLYWMMEFVADAPVGTDFVYVGPMDDLLERLGPVPEEGGDWPSART